MQKISVFLLAIVVLAVASCSKNIFILTPSESNGKWTFADIEKSAIEVRFNDDWTFTVSNMMPFPVYITGDISVDGNLAVIENIHKFRLESSAMDGKLPPNTTDWGGYDADGFIGNNVTFFAGGDLTDSTCFFQKIDGGSWRQFQFRGLTASGTPLRVYSLIMKFMAYESDIGYDITMDDAMEQVFWTIEAQNK